VYKTLKKLFTNTQTFVTTKAKHITAKKSKTNWPVQTVHTTQSHVIYNLLS